MVHKQLQCLQFTEELVQVTKADWMQWSVASQPQLAAPG